MKSENLVEHVESDEMAEENVNLEESEVKHEMPEVLKQFSLWKPIGEREHFRLNNYRYELIDFNEQHQFLRTWRYNDEKDMTRQNIYPQSLEKHELERLGIWDLLTDENKNKVLQVNQNSQNNENNEKGGSKKDKIENKEVIEKRKVGRPKKIKTGENNMNEQEVVEKRRVGRPSNPLYAGIPKKITCVVCKKEIAVIPAQIIEKAKILNMEVTELVNNYKCRSCGGRLKKQKSE